ncbi:MAG TPA: flagellar biosynthetic protein FliO [Actinomycetota bacterium]|nr:flagellar biosynthetic protein FliO [Actinomycetota bacterium]
MSALTLGEVARVVGTLLLIVGGLAVAARLAGRSRGATRGSVRVLSRVALTRGASIALVSAGRRLFLLGASDHGVALLSELAPEDLDTRVSSEQVPVPWGPGTSIPDPPSGGPGTGLVHRLQLITLRRGEPRLSRVRRG